MEQPTQTSGAKTADAAIAARPCRVVGVVLNPAAADSTVILYDNASAASGTKIVTIAAKANAAESTVFMIPQGIECMNGCYADVSGTSAEYYVLFSYL